MLRLLLVSVLAMSLLAQSAAAQTPEPTKGSTYVTGTALDLIPEGKPGVIDIIPVGPYGPAGIPVVVWNNTSEAVTGLQVAGMIRTATGLLRAVVTVEAFPGTILPGQFAYTVVPFADQIPQPPTPTEVITFESFFPQPASFVPLIRVPLDIVGAQRTAEGITGTVRNQTDQEILLILVEAMCFDASGQAVQLYHWIDGPEPPLPPIAPDADVTVLVQTRGPCDRFLITAYTMIEDPASSEPESPWAT